MDPVGPWSAGNQLVALNYQNSGVPLFLNHGLFMENNSCGYVLKPHYMLIPGITHMPEQVLKVHVISGQQLPKPGGAAYGEVIDPYVSISLHGVGLDKMEFRTRTVDNNGFNPVWDEVIFLELKYISM
jgi:hypothetical protein